jgi:NADH-quinone oxidoreductase chain I
MKYFANIVSAIKTTFEGMTITFSHLFRQPITIQYPDKTEKPVRDMLSPRYRGFLKVETNLCTACTLCEKTCPIQCIKIVAVKDAELNQRVMTRFDIDLAKCMYCGLCTEVCPTEAIHCTREFEGATSRLQDLLKKFVKEGEKVVPYRKG